MEKATSKTIEVTVISGEGLLLNKKKPVKKNLSITVKSDPFHSRSTGNLDTNSSAWNEKMVMELPPHARFLTVEAYSGSKVIGTANIPVTDFSGGCLPENYLSFLSYRLRDPYGDRNGIVNLSVQVRGGGNNPAAAAVAAGCLHPWKAAPAVSGGFVMGVPVSYRY